MRGPDVDGPGEDPRSRRSRLALAAFLIAAGAMHFAAPTVYDRIIPTWVPGRPRWWTSASGAAEIAAGALVAFPRTRKLGAWAAVATFVGVYPANVQMAIDNPPQTLMGVAAWARLPFQVPIVAWALRHAKAS